MKTQSSLLSLYEQDYQKWLEETVELLRHRSFNLIDIDHLIDEVEAMGKNQKDALESNLTIVLMHLLKYQYQPEKRQDSNSWRYTIVEHRRRLLRLLKKNPSLQRYFEEVLEECYQDGRQDAKTETQLPLDIFPADCPFSIQEILNPDYLPIHKLD